MPLDEMMIAGPLRSFNFLEDALVRCKCTRLPLSTDPILIQFLQVKRVVVVVLDVNIRCIYGHR